MWITMVPVVRTLEKESADYRYFLYTIKVKEQTRDYYEYHFIFTKTDTTTAKNSQCITG